MVSTAGAVAGVPVVDLAEVADGMAIGQQAGPWVVERELGRGGMGAVYAVVHDTIGKRAALKVVHRRLLTPSFKPERMLLEAKVVNQIGHPNIVDIFETGMLPDGRPYIVMERLEGQSLADRADEGKVLPDQAIGILLQVCDALVAAHAAGIIHRDLKLDNIFLVDNPDDLHAPKVKLLDWGIAKVIHHQVRHTIEGQLVGTPQYLSPEQARGGAIAPATDVYSLGVLAYELFLEQLPFEAETSAEIMAMHLRATPPAPSELWPEIPPALEELLLQMLAKHPDDRPTMLEVARRLEGVRIELQRRRVEKLRLSIATVLPASPIIVPPIPGIDPPRTEAPLAIPPTRRTHAVRSNTGLAPTEYAIEPGTTKRWQIVLGGFAMVASALLVLLTRDGDTPTANAESTVPAAITAPIAVHEAAPVADAEVAPEELAETAPATATEAPAKPASTSRSSKARQARSSATSKSGVPRRAAKVDPDGTLESY